MRARSRYRLAPLVVAAAILSAVLPTHVGASAAVHRTVTLAGPYCPAGTNWDDAIQTCI
jgi:uncharacterized membrane protein